MQNGARTIKKTRCNRELSAILPDWGGSISIIEPTPGSTVKRQVSEDMDRHITY